MNATQQNFSLDDILSEQVADRKLQTVHGTEKKWPSMRLFGQLKEKILSSNGEIEFILRNSSMCRHKLHKEVVRPAGQIDLKFSLPKLRDLREMAPVPKDTFWIEINAKFEENGSIKTLFLKKTNEFRILGRTKQLSEATRRVRSTRHHSQHQDASLPSSPFELSQSPLSSQESTDFEMIEQDMIQSFIVPSFEVPLQNAAIEVAVLTQRRTEESYYESISNLVRDFQRDYPDPQMLSNLLDRIIQDSNPMSSSLELGNQICENEPSSSSTNSFYFSDEAQSSPILMLSNSDDEDDQVSSESSFTELKNSEINTNFTFSSDAVFNEDVILNNNFFSNLNAVSDTQFINIMMSNEVVGSTF